MHVTKCLVCYYVMFISLFASRCLGNFFFYCLHFQSLSFDIAILFVYLFSFALFCFALLSLLCNASTQSQLSEWLILDFESEKVKISCSVLSGSLPLHGL